MFTLGVLGTGLAFLIFDTLIASVARPRRRWCHLAPGFAVFYGAVSLDETVTSGAIGGLVLILAGSGLAVEGREPWQPEPVPPEPAPVTA